MLPIILGLIVGLLLCNLHVTYKYQNRIKKQPQNKDYLEKELEKEKKQVIIYWLAIVFILIAPIVINFFFSLDIQFPTAPHLGNTEWLGFWGSYTGGVIGAIVTGIAFFFTYKQNEKQHDETRKQMLDQQRLQVLPILSITGSISSFTGYCNALQCTNLASMSGENSERLIWIELSVKNISSSPALFFELEGSSGCLCGHILSGAEVRCKVAVPLIEEDKEYDFNLIFKDTLGNKYYQKVTYFCESAVLDAHKIPSFSQPAFPQLAPNPSCKTDPSTRQPSEVNL